MANDSDPESIAELLQALDDVREAARRVEQERNLAVDRPEPAAGAREPHRLERAGHERQPPN
jgi:hypothetical protein